jgi:HSP20 family protein
MEIQRWNPFKFKRSGDGKQQQQQTALARPSASLAPAAWTPQTMLESMNRLMNQVFSERFMGDMFEPFTNLDRFFGDFSPARFQPAVDIVDDGKSLRVTCELPGMTKDDIEVSVENDLLTIHGEKKLEQTREDEECYRTERFHGRFSRAIPLPDDVDIEKAEAKFQNGILTMTLPKTKSDGKAKNIEIKA